MQGIKYEVVQTVSPISPDFLSLAIKLNFSDRLIYQTVNKQGRAERKLHHVKMSSGATYAVGLRRTRPRAIPPASTKISRIDGLSLFLTHGPTGARAAPLLSRGGSRGGSVEPPTPQVAQARYWRLLTTVYLPLAKGV